MTHCRFADNIELETLGGDAMPIKFPCPGCQKTISVPDHYAGKKAKCPGCQAPITIPHPAQTAPTPAPAPKKKVDDDDLGLAPLDDEPVKPVAPPAKPAAASKPVAPTKPTTASKPAATSKPTVSATNSLGIDDLGLTPLENDLFDNAPAAKPTPVAQPAITKPTAASSNPKPTQTAKPSPTPSSKPTPSKQLATPRPTKPPSLPVADEAPTSSLGLDELGMTPLVDDLFGSPAPAAKHVTSKPSVKAVQPAAPAAIDPDDDGLEYDLAPAAVNLSELPVATATAGMVPQGNQNPYAAPQSMTGGMSSGAAVGKLRVLSVMKEFLINYRDGIKYGIGFSMIVLGICIFWVLFVLGIAYIPNLMVKSGAMTYEWAIFFRLVGIAIIVATYGILGWIFKGFIHLGNCIAHQDYRSAERAIESPGSYWKFFAIYFSNGLLGLLLSIPLIFLAQDPYLGILLVPLFTCFMLLLNTNLFLFLQYDLGYFDTFSHWKRIVLPHFWNYLALQFLMQIILIPIIIISLVGLYFLHSLLVAILKEFNLKLKDNYVIIMTVVIGFKLMIGVYGSYFTVFQATCLKRMVRIWKDAGQP
jgi:hypothetical protein